MKEKNAKKQQPSKAVPFSDAPKRRGRPPKIKAEIPKTPENIPISPEEKAKNYSGRIYKKPPYIETNTTGAELLVVSLLFAIYEEIVGITLRLENPDASLEEIQNDYAQHETLGFLRGLVFPTLKKKGADKPYDGHMLGIFNKILEYRLEGQKA